MNFYARKIQVMKNHRSYHSWWTTFINIKAAECVILISICFPVRVLFLGSWSMLSFWDTVFLAATKNHIVTGILAIIQNSANIYFALLCTSFSDKLNLLFTFLYWMAIESNCVWYKSLIVMIIADNNNVLTIASLWAPVVAVSSFYLFIFTCKNKFGIGWLTECNRSRFFYFIEPVSERSKSMEVPWNEAFLVYNKFRSP